MAGSCRRGFVLNAGEVGVVVYLKGIADGLGGSVPGEGG